MQLLFGLVRPMVHVSGVRQPLQVRTTPSKLLQKPRPCVSHWLNAPAACVQRSPTGNEKYPRDPPRPCKLITCTSERKEHVASCDRQNHRQSAARDEIDQRAQRVHSHAALSERCDRSICPARCEGVGDQRNHAVHKRSRRCERAHHKSDLSRWPPVRRHRFPFSKLQCIDIDSHPALRAVNERGGRLRSA